MDHEWINSAAERQKRTHRDSSDLGPDSEVLQLSGDVHKAEQQLCELSSDDWNRITYDQKTNTITVDLNGIDLSQNEGASLLNNLVNSSNVYNLAVGDTVQTAGGPVSLGGDNSILNLDKNLEDRYSKGKTRSASKRFRLNTGMDPRHQWTSTLATHKERSLRGSNKLAVSMWEGFIFGHAHARPSES